MNPTQDQSPLALWSNEILDADRPEDLLVEILKRFPRPCDYICRGESSVYPESRPLMARIEFGEPEYARIEVELLAEFRQIAGHGFSDSERAMTRSIWGTLVAMQHHGAPTRLLDWSYSPWVALYFACASSPDSDGVVWALEQNAAKAVSKRSPDSIGDSTERGMCAITSLQGWLEHFRKLSAEPQWLMTLHPSRAPERLSLQQGLFTLSGTIGLDHRGWLADQTCQTKRVAILVRAKHKSQVLATLRSMNISHSSLFPGIDGAGRTVHELMAHRIPGITQLDDWAQ